MKNATNLLCVLFLFIGIGFVYAGKGVCVEPPSELTYDNTFLYYDSGRVSVRVFTQKTKYPDMYCEGEEGTCVLTEYSSDAVLYHTVKDTWFFNDTDDDFEKTQDHWHEGDIITTGRHTCT